MGLDPRGIISAVEIAVYIPVLFFTLFLTLRHGFKRDAGWISLLIFSFVRVIGAALLVSADTLKNPSTGLLVAAFILEAVGLTPLLSATIGFLGIVGQRTLSGVPLVPPRVSRIVRLLLTVAVVLAVVGSIDASQNDAGSISTGTKLRKASAILYVAIYIAIAALHGFFWARRDEIFTMRRTLLVAISAALPFLAVRLLYSVLSSFSPNTLTSNPAARAAPNALSKFNSVTGAWQLFLVLSVIMEFIVILIYCTAGTLLRLDEGYNAAGRKSEDHELYAPPSVPPGY